MKHKTYLKQFVWSHIKSGWSVLMVLPILLITILIYQSTQNSLSFSVGHIMQTFGYYNLFMGVVYAVYGAYCAFSIDDFEISLFSRSRVLLLRILAGLAVTMLSVLTVMLITTVLSLRDAISMRLFVSYLIYIFVKFFTQIIVLFSVGFVLGTFIKNRFLYLAAVAVSFLFSPLFDLAFQSAETHPVFTNFFNLAFQNPNHVQFAAIGRLNKTFFSHSAFWIVAGMVIISALLLHLHTKKWHGVRLSALPISMVVLLLLFQWHASVFPVRLFFEVEQDQYYGLDRNKVNLFVDDGSNQPALDYFIQEMKMEVQLGGQLRNKCTLKVQKSPDTKFVKFRLDEVFNARAYYYGTYTFDGEIYKPDDPEKTVFRNGDDLYIPVEGIVEDEFELEIHYQGHLNYQNGLHSRVFYSTNESSHLPQFFAWYPQIVENNNDIVFDVTIHANNHFVSNVSDNRLVKEGVFQNTATLKQLYILSGYFAEVAVDDLNVIIFEGYRKQTDVIREHVAFRLDAVREQEAQPENNWEDILENYWGGGYTQPLDSSKIDTVIYAPFYFFGFVPLYQYENIYFTTEI